MTIWYSDPAVGGDGKYYNDEGNDTDPYRKLDNGGFRTWWGSLFTSILDVAAWIAALSPGAVLGANSAGTSTTSLAIGTGSKTLTTQAAKIFPLNCYVTVGSSGTPGNLMHGYVTAYDSGTGVLTFYSQRIEGTGTFTDWIVALSAPPAAIGRQTIGVAGGAIFPATTNGCAGLSQAETASNKINYKYLAFDAAAVEYACFAFPSPKAYNASTVSFRVVWTHPATTVNFKVAWALAILALANDDAIDTALGTAVQVNDTGGTTQDFYTSDESAAVTPGNTAAKQDWMFCRVSRVATDGTNDTLAVDAHLLGIEVYYTTDAPNDA